MRVTRLAKAISTWLQIAEVQKQADLRCEKIQDAARKKKDLLEQDLSARCGKLTAEEKEKYDALVAEYTTPCA